MYIESYFVNYLLKNKLQYNHTNLLAYNEINYIYIYQQTSIINIAVGT